MWLGKQGRLHSTVGSTSNYRPRGHKFESQFSVITYIEIDCEKNSMAILHFALIPEVEEGQLSVTGKSICTKYWLAT